MNTNTPATQQQVKVSPSERFMNAVIKELTRSSGKVEISEQQQRMMKKYFINLDTVLKKSEQTRLAKKEEYRDLIPVTWENINWEALSVDVVAYSSIGLDPTQKNHLSLIPYKDNKSGKYNITFTEEYRGLELKAKKYGYEVPDDIIIEVVYQNDHFKSLKKNGDRKIESYEFEITNDFDRGEIKGGFYYYVFNESPEKNRIRVFNMAQIEKRIPKTAAAEFWGGEKQLWKDGKKAGTEKVEGWRDEMVYKTIARAAYNNITIDATKIDDHVMRIIENEQNLLPEDFDNSTENIIQQKANTKEFNYDDAEVIDEKPKELPAEQPKPEVKQTKTAEPVQRSPEPKVDKDGVPQLNFGS